MGGVDVIRCTVAVGPSCALLPPACIAACRKFWEAVETLPNAPLQGRGMVKGVEVGNGS